VRRLQLPDSEGTAPPPPPPSPAPRPHKEAAETTHLREQARELKEELSQIRKELAKVRAQFEQAERSAGRWESATRAALGEVSDLRRALERSNRQLEREQKARSESETRQREAVRAGRQTAAELEALRRHVEEEHRARAAHLLPLPTVQVVEADPYDPATLARHARGMTAAINLVGVLHEHGRATFERAHVELPAALAAACQGAGVNRVLHMSALGASRDAPSRYLRSIADGEASIAASALAWTIFRPSVIFGREDTFLNLFGKLARWFPVLLLAGANARFQPIHVGDVATCFVRALADNETIGKHYALCGPVVYTLAHTTP
jgi:uncharacterized protein YbjT (DUF2867 family)